MGSSSTVFVLHIDLAGTSGCDRLLPVNSSSGFGMSVANCLFCLAFDDLSDATAGCVSVVPDDTCVGGVGAVGVSGGGFWTGIS